MMRVTEARLLQGAYADAALFNLSGAAAQLPRLHQPDGQGDGPKPDAAAG
jgi:hypothetical protein